MSVRSISYWRPAEKNRGPGARAAGAGGPERDVAARADHDLHVVAALGGSELEGGESHRGGRAGGRDQDGDGDFPWRQRRKGEATGGIDGPARAASAPAVAEH